MNWDDLRLVLAIADQGSMAAAARALMLDNSTVFRRLNALEKALQVRLFDRTRSACLATADGEQLIEAARRCQAAVDEAQLRIAGADARLTGPIRLTATPLMSRMLIVPMVADFMVENPGIELELLEVYTLLDLGHREADIALRVTRKPPENLVGTRLGALEQGVYGLASRFGRVDAEAAGLPWIEQSAGRAGAESSWRKSEFPNARVALRAESGVAVYDAICAGIGVGLLPRVLGNGNASLVRIGNSAPSLSLDLWLLTHPHLRHVARIRALMKHLRTAIAAVLAPQPVPGA